MKPFKKGDKLQMMSPTTHAFTKHGYLLSGETLVQDIEGEWVCENKYCPYVVSHPDIKNCYTEGEPSITLRHI